MVGSAAGGFLGGLLHPKHDEEEQRGRDIQRAQAAAQVAGQVDDAQRKGELAAANLRRINAAAAYDEARPELEQSKATARASKGAQAAVRADLKLHPHPFDPTSADDAAFLHRAADAGVFLDVDNWGRGGKNDRAVTFIDPSDPTRVVSGYYNTFTGEVAPLTRDGQPVPKGYVQPVHGDTQMTSAQERADADRDAGRVETHRHNVVGETQGGQRVAQGNERIGIARDNQAARGAGGMTATQTNARLARAAELNRKLEEEKNKAANPPASLKGADGQWQPTSERVRTAYTARHKQAAAGYRDQIKSAYSDIYEVGEDGDG